MRTKEEANDYRYFPDPDLLPIDIDEEYIQDIKRTLPDMPDVKMKFYKDEYKLNDEQINIILSSFDIMQFLEKVISTTKIEPKKIVNYFISSLYIKINKENYDLNDKNIEPQEFCHIIEALESNKISKNNLKKIIDELFLKKDSVDKIIDNLSVKNGNDDKFIDDLIEEIIINNKKQVDDYKNGKTKILGFFVGQVLKKAKNYDPSLIKEKIIKALEDI